MTKVMRRACTEVNEILNVLPKEYGEKVPLKFRRMFYDARLEDYHVSIDPNKSIKEQNVVYETFVILTILKMNYWCHSEEEKNKLNHLLEENGRRVQEQYDFSKLNYHAKEILEEKKNQDSIEHISMTHASTTGNNLPAKVENHSWFSKLWNQIKNIFKKK